MFEPIPIEDAFDIMMQARAKKSRELNTKTQELIQKLKINDKIAVEEPQFFLISKGIRSEWERRY